MSDVEDRYDAAEDLQGRVQGLSSENQTLRREKQVLERLVDRLTEELHEQGCELSEVRAQLLACERRLEESVLSRVLLAQVMPVAEA